jgi:prophage regulatory protein
MTKAERIKRGLAEGATPEFFTIDAVCALVGVCRSTIYFWMDDGAFPKPCRIGRRRVAWRAADVVAWCDSRPQVA